MIEITKLLELYENFSLAMMKAQVIANELEGKTYAIHNDLRRAALPIILNILNSGDLNIEGIEEESNFVIARRLLAKGDLRQKDIHIDFDLEIERFKVSYIHKGKRKAVFTALNTILSGDKYTSNLIKPPSNLILPDSFVEELGQVN